MKNNAVPRTWNWTVMEQPIYNVSGNILYNCNSGLEGVLMQRNSKKNTTIASGSYLITGLPDGICNVSFSKAGLNTACLDVTVNSVNKPIVNTSYDTTFTAKDSYNSWGQNLPILSFKTAPHSDIK